MLTRTHFSGVSFTFSLFSRTADSCKKAFGHKIAELAMELAWNLKIVKRSFDIVAFSFLISHLKNF